jgi:hypothetical protein
MNNMIKGVVEALRKFAFVVRALIDGFLASSFFIGIDLRIIIVGITFVVLGHGMSLSVNPGYRRFCFVLAALIEIAFVVRVIVRLAGQ